MHELMVFPVGWGLALLSGSALAGGLALALGGLVARPARLGDVLHQLDGASGALPTATASEGSWDERVGHWVLRRTRLPVTEQTRRALSLQDRTLTDFAVEKLALAALGFAAPMAFLAMSAILGLGVGWLPVGLSLAMATVGWFIPDLRLRRAVPRLTSDAGEALCTFVDLVALERLANQSSTQALHHAAEVSDVPLFRSLRVALLGARLEQRPAWQALREVADELKLPQLADLADVMRLDEQGAALGTVLRARADELRDAQLLHDKVKAQTVSESLTLWMAVPALVFGLLFLVPPLLRLLQT